MEINSKPTFYWGVSLMLLAISFGAMGAHLLEKVLDVTAMKSFQTAINYAIYQGLAFLILSLLNPISIRKPVLFMKIGISCFSGSILMLVFMKHLGIGIPKLLVLITPLGGVLLIMGWLTMFFVSITKNKV